MDAKSLIDARNPVRLLVVGTDVPEYVAVAAATRVIPACDPALPTGIYSFTSALGCEVLLLNEGDPPVAPTEASWVEDEDPLVRAYGWFSHWWKEASEVPTRFSMLVMTYVSRHQVKAALYDRGDS